MIFLARLGATLAVTVRNLAQLWAPWWRDLGAKRAPMEREERNKEKNKKEESNKERKKKERKRNMKKENDKKVLKYSLFYEWSKRESYTA